MRSKYSVPAVSALVFLPLLFLPVVLTGQRAQEVVVPLKNWAAPLYWQPNQAEREAAVGVSPKLQFSPSQVSPSALTFVAISPCRLVDTRGVAADFNGISPFSGPSLGPSSTTTFPVQSTAEATADTTPTPCGTIPSIAQAYSFNITAIPKTAGGIAFVTVWPAGAPQPGVSTINDGEGAILANAAIVPAGTPSGGVNVLNSGPATMDLTIDMNGYYAAPTDLVGNTAVGSGALVSNTSGSNNTAIGDQALQHNTTGDFNVATGVNALQTNNGGSYNTASGVQALEYNTTGQWNTAVGYNSLQGNTTGGSNTAVGYEALGVSTTGSGSTAVGFGSLEYSIATGAPAGNTAVGYQALQGSSNTSVNTGTLNTAMGYQALYQNTTGSNNTAVGISALLNNTTGVHNIAIGVNAGLNVGNGTGLCALYSCGYNIDIGNPGQNGDAGIIRIGDPSAPDQGPTYINGIFTTNIEGGAAVVVDSNGALGVAGSSRRYKEDIQDMGGASRGLMDLRPVTFRYKKAAEDGSRPLQYGLIAEEVEEVYPDLVVHLKDGRAHTVQYQMLPAMLLNEVQKQNHQAEQQDETIRRQQEQIKSLETRLAALEASLSGKAPATATAVR